MLLNILNMRCKLCYIPMALYIIYLVQVPLNKMVEPKGNFVIFLTLFVLFFFLPTFLPLLGVKLLLMLFMRLIAFQALSSIIKLRMSVSLGQLLTIITFDLLDLLVSFFFNLMNTTNLSLDLNFVVSLVMAKLKKGIGVMIMSLILFVFLVMLSFGTTDYLLNSLTFVLP